MCVCAETQADLKELWHYLRCLWLKWHNLIKAQCYRCNVFKYYLRGTIVQPIVAMVATVVATVATTILNVTEMSRLNQPTATIHDDCRAISKATRHWGDRAKFVTGTVRPADRSLSLSLLTRSYRSTVHGAPASVCHPVASLPPVTKTYASIRF